MKITAFIFTYTNVAPLLPACIRALRRNPGSGNTLDIVALDDANAPLGEDTVALLVKDGVAVVQTKTNRRGNLRGFAIANEIAGLMFSESADSEIVIGMDPDTLIPNVEALVKPLVDDPEAGMAGHDMQTPHGVCLGQAYAVRRATMGYIASKLAGMDGAAVEFAVDYLSLRLTWPANFMWIDFVFSALANQHAPVLVNKYAWTTWKHFGEERDPGEVMRNNAVVLLGNPNVRGLIESKDRMVACAKMLLNAADEPKAERPVLAGGAKPVVVLGASIDTNAAANLAAVLASQPGVTCEYLLFDGTCHEIVVDEAMNALAHWRKLKWRITQATFPVWCNVSVSNAWRAGMMIPYLEEAGYDWRVVAVDAPLADDGKLISRWDAESAKADADAVALPVSRTAIPVAKAADAAATQQAVVADYRAKLGALVAAHPQKLRVLQAADLADQSAMAALFDWIGLPAAGRRNELVGAAINARAS